MLQTNLYISIMVYKYTTNVLRVWVNITVITENVLHCRGELNELASGILNKNISNVIDIYHCF